MVRQLEPGDLPVGVAFDQADLGPLVGRQIGLYRLDRLLFIASGAAFYATQHPVSGEPRTARVESIAPGMLEERRSEIESAAVFSAPSVPAIYHVDVLDGLLVVVTDAFDARPASELP